MRFVETTLGGICDQVNGIIRTGPFGSQLHQSDYQEEGTPVVMPVNLAGNRVSTEDVARIGEEDLNRLSQHRLEVGDIVYARRGDIGRRAFISERETGWLCGTGCLRISLGDQVLDPRFLYYYLGQPKLVEWIYNQAVGATMPNLNTSIVRSIPVSYPRLTTQRNIAAILSAYDGLIENNTQRIEILEEMAAAIYREWFVHLRYPGHEEDALTDTLIPGTTQRLPAGWELKQLGEVLELAYGKGLRKKDRVAGPFPVYGSSGIIDWHEEPLVQGPGIIVGRKGNVGSVFWSDIGFCPIDTTYYVQTTLPLHYVYYNLRHQNFLDTHAAVPGLSRKQAYLNPFVVPSSNLLMRFQKFIEPIFAMLEILKDKNENLRQTRDLLLPRLVSGRVDVSELEIAAPR